MSVLIITLLIAFIILLDIKLLNTKIIKLVLFIGLIIGCTISLYLLRISIVTIPSYIFLLIAFIFTVVRYHKGKIDKPIKKGKIFRMISSSVWLVICLFIIYLFPQFHLPEPDGAYGIGTVDLEMIDKNREETYTEDSEDFRKIMVQVWYPTSKSSDATFVSYPSEVGAAIQSVLKVPSWFFSYFSNIKTNTSYKSNIVENNEKFPLVLYSPGNQSTRFQNMALIEEMVSNGYIVVGIDHPYTSNDVIFQDGSISVRSDGEKSSLTDVPMYEYEIDIRTKDAIFALDELENGNISDDIKSITDKIDFDEIGFMGHSYGGATVAEALATDQRFKAGVSFDGGLWGTAAKQGIKQPFFYMSATKTTAIMNDTSESNKSTREFVSTVISNLISTYKKSSADFYFSQMKDYNHYSFTDLPLISPLFNSGEQSVNTTISLTLTFFNKYLKHDEDADLKTLSEQYQYVNFMQGSDIIFPE